MTSTAEFPAAHAPSRSDVRFAFAAVLATTATIFALRLATPASDVATVHAEAALPGVAITDFGPRASHNGLYRAEMAAAAVNPGEPHQWLVRLEQRNHRRLAHAHVQVRLWMPELGIDATTRPMVTYIGDGNYRLDNVRMPRSGWWNVALVVDGRAGVDSLAFNLRTR